MAEATPTRPAVRQPAGDRAGVTGADRAGERGARPVAAWWRLLASELLLVLRRTRNLASLGVLAAVPVLIAVAVRVRDGSGGGGGGGAAAFFGSITSSGLFVALAAIVAQLPLFLPVAVAAVAGDAVAGEAHSGTLRYLLLVPAGRSRLLAVKAVSLVVFCAVAVLVVAVVGVLAGLVLFGPGHVVLLSGTQVSFGVGLWRLALVVAYLTACLAALSAVGLFVSTLTDSPLAALVATLVVAVASQVLDAVPQVAVIHPYLLTHDWLAFGDLLRDPVSFAGPGRGLVVAAVWAAVAWAAAWARFTGRDVAS